jgi:hypothetical protein
MARGVIYLAKNNFILENNKYYKICNYDLSNSYKIDFWNIDETIPELAYLTHDYFRYYGKFPSKVGKNIISELLNSNLINKNNDFVFDNYEGCGTSLVEAKIAGLDSIGIDINPFGVLASRVKTYNLDVNLLIRKWDVLSNEISLYINYFRNKNNCLLNFDVNEEMVSKINNTEKSVYVEFKDILKWFNERVIKDLAVIKTLLLELELDRYREFFSLAFFAIIRRVSTAYDGEVRPHVNKKKKQRDVLEAYFKKVNEMIITMREWNQATDSNTYSDSFVCSNLDEIKINEIINNTKKALNKDLGLVISHPPYLNCFDYIPVYKLKFLWAFGFEEIYGTMDYSEIKRSEIKSYPASSDKLIDQYFENNKKTYSIVYNNLRKGGYCCVVIGDCTVQNQLFSVHKGFIKILEEIGFSVDKIVYRSTHYGLGKYAYNFRADYHENDDGKKDAIIFFKK